MAQQRQRQQQMQPPRQAQPPPEPIATEVQILASTQGLGTFVADYKAKLAKVSFLNTRSIIILTLLSILGGAGLIAVAYSGYGHTVTNLQAVLDLIVHLATTSWSILGLVLLLFGLWFAFNTVRYYGLHVYAYTEGLVRLKGNRVDAIRWDQVKMIWQKVNKRFIGAFPIGTVHAYTVQRDDGKKFTFNDGLSNVGALGDTIIRGVVSKLLPEAIDNYNAGKPVVFGKLSASIHGISNGDEIVLWNQVKSVRVNKGVLAIDKDGQWLNWPTIIAAKTPNFPVFLALVDYALKGR